MRRLWVLGAVLLVAFVAAPAFVDAQEDVAVQVVEVGWWSNRPTAASQPEDGFEVVAGPTGDTQSVAAIRLSISGSQIDSLPVSLDELAAVGTEFGILRVCTTSADWEAADPGALDDAPVPNCASQVNLTRTVDGSWLGDLAALAPTGGEVNLMIVPVYQPPVPVGPGMIVTIAEATFSATGSTSTATTAIGSNPTPTPPPDTGIFVPTPDTGFETPSGGGGVVDAGPTTTTSAPPETTTTTAGEQVDDFALDPIGEGSGGSKPWGRLIVLLPLSAGLGFGGVRLQRFLADRGFQLA